MQQVSAHRIVPELPMRDFARWLVCRDGPP